MINHLRRWFAERGLSSRDPHRRVESIRLLLQVKPPTAVSLISVLLDDPEVDVAKAAVHALAAIREQPAVKQLVRALLDRRQEVWGLAVRYLVAFGESAIVEIRQAYIGRQFYREKNHELPEFVLEPLLQVIEAVGGSECFETLLLIIKDHPSPRMVASLAKFGDAAVPYFEKRLKERHRPVWLVQVLGAIGTPQAHRVLLGVVHDKEGYTGDWIQAETCLVLSSAAPPGTVAAFRGLLEKADTSRAGLVAAINGLAKLDGAGHASYFEKLLTSSDEYVRSAAASALDTIGWQPHSEDIAIAYHVAKYSWDHLLQYGAKAKQAIIRVIESFSSRDYSLDYGYKSCPALGAIEALSKVGTPDDVVHLRKALESENSTGIRVAVEAIGRLRAVQCAETLLDILEANSGTVSFLGVYEETRKAITNILESLPPSDPKLNQLKKRFCAIESSKGTDKRLSEAAEKYAPSTW